MIKIDNKQFYLDYVLLKRKHITKSVTQKNKARKMKLDFKVRFKVIFAVVINNISENIKITFYKIKNQNVKYLRTVLEVAAT